VKYGVPALKGGRYKEVFCELEFGVGVRAYFAVEIDLFVLRGDPFHEWRSLSEMTTGRE
jgi:hypothetical protein